MNTTGRVGDAKAQFPAPALCLRVGVTANRWRLPGEPEGFRISPEHRATLQQTVSNVLTHVQRAVQRVYDSDTRGDYYARVQPVINLISPLAEGGDRLVATVARSLERPWPIDVIVPCDISARPDRDPHFPLAPLWSVARSRLVLDGDQDDDESLIETNRRMLWNCDLLVAIWDNKEGRGEAGTASVVGIAAELGLPVVQIDADPDPLHPLTHKYRVREPEGMSSSLQGANIDSIVARLLGPPQGTEHEVHEALRDTAEYATALEAQPASETDQSPMPDTPADVAEQRKVLAFLNAFRSERVSTRFVRGATGFMWALVMRVLTAGKERVQHFAWTIKGSVEEVYGPPWEQVILPAPTMTDALGALVTPSFQRADYFATSYATRHRGSTVWIVLLAPMAVLFAWYAQNSAGVFATAAAGFELAALTAILFIYSRARQKQFHARWLDYRLLAERLRHLGFLWPAGRASLVMRVPVQYTPEDPHTAWVNWWYRALARQLPVPSVVFSQQYLEWYRAFLREQVVKDQQNYLDGVYHTAEAAEGRVRVIAWTVFGLALIAAILHVGASAIDVELPHSLEVAIRFIAIVFPGFGAAAHAFGSNLGLPEQALRSASTLRALGVVREGLREVDTSKPLASIELGDLAQQTAGALGDDLFGWRVDYLVRPTPQPG